MTKPDARGSSAIHRMPAGIKLLALAVAGSAVVLVGDWRVMLACLALALLLYPAAGLTFRDAARQLRPLLWMLVILFAAQAWFESFALAALVVLRIAALVALAALVTLTTPMAAMIAVVERVVSPFRRLGVDPEKVGLAFALALRFIPVIAAQAGEIREAQRARGLDRNLVALALPLIVRTLRTADAVADAVEARSFDADAAGERVARLKMKVDRSSE
ncbi:energy-coupling factor transporter transmembrane component T family protein [Consotaella salsifontis]|uniref:Biotin transport system permease protein n=1 Tax=Consotaella salsifontis TaxID=1365950 RepID=A0A1T4L3H9_9HYPH|nr:energy-coupling factor transporter transmembrane protein EcfT [Consotaella salsifontis]SJZ49148.1 biotin transport system permease protein [Consotaella salsifontis]